MVNRSVKLWAQTNVRDSCDILFAVRPKLGAYDEAYFGANTQPFWKNNWLVNPSVWEPGVAVILPVCSTVEDFVCDHMEYLDTSDRLSFMLNDVIYYVHEFFNKVTTFEAYSSLDRERHRPAREFLLRKKPMLYGCAWSYFSLPGRYRMAFGEGKAGLNVRCDSTASVNINGNAMAYEGDNVFCDQAIAEINLMWYRCYAFACPMGSIEFRVPLRFSLIDTPFF